jgi:hypothetical protein
MNVYSFDPLRDPRWAPFVERAERASVFHTPGWLQALERTYGFTPIAFTTSRPADDLADGVVFAGVRSWLTGNRLVSLPFSDHCDPLVQSPEAFQAICRAALEHRARDAWHSVELRPLDAALPPGPGFAKAQTYYVHRRNLRPPVDALYRTLHKDSVQRKIRRAEKEGLAYQAGRSDALVRDLYRLLDMTRRRHRAPLQPLAWFRNLVDCFGERLCIRITYHQRAPTAGMLTVSHGRTTVYKYGGSDTRLNALGGMPFLFWQAMQEARELGAWELDLGRSDQDNPGLVTFKDRRGAARSVLTYWRSAGSKPDLSVSWKAGLAGRALSALPGGLRRAAGAMLYKHIG